MVAQCIDGRLQAQRIKAELTEELRRSPLQVGLATILVGEDPASASYVRSKRKACQEVGIDSFHHHLPEQTSQSQLEALIGELMADPKIHGILVQLPLPPHMNSEEVLDKIAPHKDVDGFHPVNLGLLANRNASIGSIPCTPAGCLELLHASNTPLAGAEAVVLGRSTIVGMPMALLLTRHDATVTVLHSRSKNFESHLRRADIVVAAIGKPEFVKGSMLKPGCTVIDVGINRVGGQLVGDVEFGSASQVARAITPVPGGVGPMTIAMLLRNVVNLARRSQKPTS